MIAALKPFTYNTGEDILCPLPDDSLYSTGRIVISLFILIIIT